MSGDSFPVGDPEPGGNGLPMEPLARLGQRRNAAIIAYCAAEPEGHTLNAQDVPILYECLRRFPDASRLDVLIHVNGGSVSASARLAKLLRHYARQLTFLVPYKARSAGTLLCLAGDGIVFGPAGELSPIDPVITSAGQGAGPAGISSEEVRLFGEMSARWFGLAEETERAAAFQVLVQKIFPTSLCSLYRAEKYVREIALELLAQLGSTLPAEKRAALVDDLLARYSEHAHGLTVDQAAGIGLPAQLAVPEDEALMWETLQRCFRYLAKASDAPGVKTDAVIFSKHFAARHIVRRIPMEMAGAPLASDSPSRPAGSLQFRSVGTWEIL